MNKLVTFYFMRPRLSRWVALGFGSGLAPFSPGTVGTLWAWATYLILDALLRKVAPQWTDAIWISLIVLGFALGVWACERCGRDLGVSDHGAMVWDEVIAFWGLLWLSNALQAGFSTQLALFLWFRLFDILKPPPIGWLEKRFKGGLGVMIDDLMAAFFALLALGLWRAI